MDRSPALPRADSAHRRLLEPIERFLHIEAASGIVLLLAAAAALVWANSNWGEAYSRFWHAPLTFAFGGHVISQPLHFWVNDGLMTIFFLVVGLEIRREMHEGALASPRHAALPLAAATGGVLAPAALYLSITAAPALAEGWAVPTATDIAFAVGVLALLGRRVPASLRVLLLAIAIIDDIAAVLIIAFFYADSVALEGLAVVLIGVVVVRAFQRVGVQTAWPYVIPGAIVWLGMMRTGVHPSIAGVVVGLLAPVTHGLARDAPLAAASRALEEFRERTRRGAREPEELLVPLRALKGAQLQLLPPALRVQAALHPWVAFGIVPLFALANAGVSITGVNFDTTATSRLLTGIVIGLVLGKPIGILLVTALAVRLGLCTLPPGVSWGGVVTIGCLAGIGFTMSIFIANLAFVEPALLDAAKLAVLVASAIALVLGLTVGWLALTCQEGSRRAAPVPQTLEGGSRE